MEEETPTSALRLLPGVYLQTDSTPVGIQKSRNQQLQKKTYSHRGINNLNLLPVEALNGRCVEVFGPYFSDGFHPDGQLLNDVLHDTDVDADEIKQNLHREQVIHKKHKVAFLKYVKEIAALSPGWTSKSFLCTGWKV